MSEDKYTKETDKRFTLRIDNNLFQIIKAYAQINRRPVGNEIEYVLGCYYAEKIKDIKDSPIYPTIAECLSKYDSTLIDFKKE